MQFAQPFPKRTYIIYTYCTQRRSQSWGKTHFCNPTFGPKGQLSDLVGGEWEVSVALYVLSGSSPLNPAGPWLGSHATPTSCTNTNPSDVRPVKWRPKENKTVPAYLHYHASVQTVGKVRVWGLRTLSPPLHDVFVCFGKVINEV